MDAAAVNFEEKDGPSTIMACSMCASVVATNALKILLGRGDVICAPRGLHIDAYRNKLKVTWRPMGNSNPIQWLAIQIAKRLV